MKVKDRLNNEVTSTHIGWAQSQREGETVIGEHDPRQWLCRAALCVKATPTLLQCDLSWFNGYGHSRILRQDKLLLTGPKLTEPHTGCFRLLRYAFWSLFGYLTSQPHDLDFSKDSRLLVWLQFRVSCELVTSMKALWVFVTYILKG